MIPQDYSTHFPLPLDGDLQPGGGSLVLDSSFIFIDGDRRIEVSAPFKTDYNSVPRGLWNVFPPWKYPEAGVVHDYLYLVPNGPYGPNGQWVHMSRGDCDRVHKRILELVGAPWILRQTAYLALRSAGWGPWRRYRALESKGGGAA